MATTPDTTEPQVAATPDVAVPARMAPRSVSAPARPWAELIALVASEEDRLGVVRDADAAATPSARLLAILSALRALAAHEAARARAATLAQARAEMERDEAVSLAARAERRAGATEEARSHADARMREDRATLKAVLLEVLALLEAKASAANEPKPDRSRAGASADRRWRRAA